MNNKILKYNDGANKTPKHPSKLKKKKKEPSILKPTYRDKWVTSSSFDHWTEITFQQYKVHHSSSSYFCLTWTMSTKLSKQKKTKKTMSFRRKLKKIKKKIQFALIPITCTQKISFSSLTF